MLSLGGSLRTGLFNTAWALNKTLLYILFSLDLCKGCVGFPSTPNRDYDRGKIREARANRKCRTYEDVSEDLHYEATQSKDHIQ